MAARSVFDIAHPPHPGPPRSATHLGSALHAQLLRGRGITHATNHPGRRPALTDANQFEHFFDEGLIEAVLRPIKSGKEASVHLCRANPRTTGEDLVALKTYHPLDRRDFRDESTYRDGEWIKERRVRVALEKKTRFGREVQGMIWVDREWNPAHSLGGRLTSAPDRVHRRCDRNVVHRRRRLRAPQLRSYDVEDTDEAEALVDQVLGAIGGCCS